MRRILPALVVFLSACPEPVNFVDTDTLAELDCGQDQLPIFDFRSWICIPRTDVGVDTTRTDEEIEEVVADDGYAIADELAAIATSASWTDLVDLPRGLEDGDDDTLATLVCNDGGHVRWDDVSGWVCSSLPGTTSPLPLADGGTGATDASGARAALGAAAVDHTHTISEVTGTLPGSQLAGTYAGPLDFPDVGTLDATTATFGAVSTTGLTVTGSTTLDDLDATGTFTGSFAGDGSALVDVGRSDQIDIANGCGLDGLTVVCVAGPSPLTTCATVAEPAFTCPISGPCAGQCTTANGAFDVATVTPTADGWADVRLRAAPLICEGSRGGPVSVWLEAVDPDDGTVVLDRADAVVAGDGFWVPVGQGLGGTLAVDGGTALTLRLRVAMRGGAPLCWQGGLLLDATGDVAPSLGVSLHPHATGF